GLLKPDVSAPTNVPTTSLSCNSCYTMSFGGTSAATPHLGGAMALLLSADTSLTPGDVTRIIQLTSLDLGDPGKDNEYGAGRIDIYRAVLSLQRSNIILSDYSIDDSSGDNDMRAEPGETVTLFVTLQNGEPWQDATGVSAILRTDDTTLTLIDSLSNFGSIPSGGSADNLSDPFTFTVNPSNPHWATFTIEINATPPSFNATETILLLIGHPDIILIDDDGGVDLESYYKEPLDNLGYVYDEWVVASQGVPPSTGTYGLQDHAVVIWFTGNDFTTLTPADTSILSDFLQNGGKFFITSQNLGEEIGSDPFYSDFLRAQFLDANANDNLLMGVTGDPIGDGISLVIQGVNGANNADSEDRITPLPGADSVFSYTNALGTAALKYDSGVYKVVYFAFPFEAIHGAGSFASRDTVMARILKWFDLSVGIEEPDSGAFRKPYSEFRLFQNHPNPFHSTTLIHYALPKVSSQEKTHVRLAVYDITGRLVETLVNQVQEPGVYKVEWEGKDQPSGIYFYRLKAGDFSATRKIVVLR
ncbi:S8 family peptidase, partial [candidate division TA06 bacterium]|nr:S8 family peptidase [candidate division TA06 bacterium]